MLTDNRELGETNGLFDQLNSNAADDIDGILAAVYSVPFSVPVPAVVKSSSRAILLYKIFDRRSQKGSRNPYYSQDRDARQNLTDFAESKRALGSGNVPFSGSVLVPCEQFQCSPSGMGNSGVCYGRF